MSPELQGKDSTKSQQTVYIIHAVLQWWIRVEEGEDSIHLGYGTDRHHLNRKEKILSTVEPLIKDTLGPAMLSYVGRLSSSWRFKMY